jgi:enoyl-CoA hydratase/carnithine racemase
MTSYETILYDVQDGVATLTINRPDQFNGMTVRMVNETYRCLTAAAADPGIRILVMTGAGRAFCPGADLKGTASGASDGATNEKASYHVARLLHEMPALTIAAINGACAGAGFGWACGADIRVAARSAKFSTAFLKVAVAGDMGIPGRCRDSSARPGRASSPSSARSSALARLRPQGSWPVSGTTTSSGTRSRAWSPFSQRKHRSPSAL